MLNLLVAGIHLVYESGAQARSLGSDIELEIT